MARRVMRICIVLPVEGRFIFRRNVVPGSPRRWELTNAVFLSVITVSLMLRMISPFFSPASAAGLPSYGSSITTLPNFIFWRITAPMPTYLPVSMFFRRFTSFSG